MTDDTAARHPFLDHPRPLAIAHRGGDETAPENTVAAFRAAVELGFRYLETDVHVTSDGVLVAFHDDRLDRVTDGHGEVARLPWSEVSTAKIGGTESIPRFEELLEEFPTARFNVDMKSEHSVIPLVRAIQRHGAADRVCIASFSSDRLRRARSLLGPGVCTAASPREITALIGRARLGERGARRADVPFGCVQVPVRHARVEVVTPAFVALVHSLGAQVHVWTIDEPAEMDRLLDLGVDGIMTDRPSVLREVLERRGVWVSGPYGG